MGSFHAVRVVGAGLIGTSIALGLKRAGYSLSIEDEYPEAERIAQGLIGQTIPNQNGAISDPELIVIATPILSIPSLVKEYAIRYPESTLIDIGGLKSEVLAEIEKFPAIASRFCATHPMAGREISGALAARGDLFEGRIWIYTPTTQTSNLALNRALELVEVLGGKAVELGPIEHDQAIAGISHLPQIVSSLLSATLLDLSDRDISLAGQGLKDVSRLAASNSDLWAQLLHSNSKAVVEFLSVYAGYIDDLSISLQNDDLRKTQEILDLGRENHRRIPGKHGGAKRDYWYLPIIIEDKPGQLAKIFDACALVFANVEDLSIEHTPGQESGLVTLALSKEDADKVYNQLSVDGWRVHEPRESIG